jgi:hypothetical protein
MSPAGKVPGGAAAECRRKKRQFDERGSQEGNQDESPKTGSPQSCLSGLKPAGGRRHWLVCLFSTSSQPLGKPVAIERVDDAIGGDRRLARDRHAPPRGRGNFTGGVRIGIDREGAAEFEAAPQPAPVEIEPPGIAVDLDRDVNHVGNHEQNNDEHDRDGEDEPPPPS